MTVPRNLRHQKETTVAWGWTAVEQLAQDIRQSARMLAKDPGFTLGAVIMLAVGLGVNAAVFTVTNAVLFKGFPLVRENDRILYITTNKGIYYPDFEEWRAQAKSFAGMGVVRGVPRNLSGPDGLTETYFTAEISADAFRLLGVPPILGRDFTPSDEKPGAAPVLILRYDLWAERFAKDPSIVGQPMKLNGVPSTVIGIMPPGFAFPEGQRLWTPPMPTPEARTRASGYAPYVFGRLSEGATIEQARAEMTIIARRTNRDIVPVVNTFHEFFIGAKATTYQALWGAVGFVLLIICANLANLLLGRAAARSREISVRVALGAGRWRIVQQLLVESLMLSSLGGILGWWIAEVGVRAYALSQGSLDWTTSVLGYAMDYRVFAYLLLISLATGILFGLIPAIHMTKLDVNAALKSGGRGATSGAHARRWSAILIGAEVGLAVILLTGAGAMIRSFLNIYRADVGASGNILTSSLNISLERYPTAETWISFYQQMEDRLHRVPGVESVTVAPTGPTERAPGAQYELAGESLARERRSVPALVVGAAYFQTLGATVLSGRAFNDFDRASSLPVVVVNQRFASRNWPGENPVGKRLRLFRDVGPDKGKTGAWLTVVGVVSNIIQNDPTMQEFEPLIYVPFRQRPGPWMFVFVRTSTPAASFANTFRREVQSIDPDARVSVVMPLDERLRIVSAFGFQRNVSALLVIFGALALLLATVGLYAVVSHSVSRRTQEIGIRMAVGATAGDIRKLVFGHGMWPVGVGLFLGIAVSLAVTRVLEAQLIGVSSRDPMTLLVASVVLVLASILGCQIPARHALRVDPVVALRND